MVVGDSVDHRFRTVSKQMLISRTVQLPSEYSTIFTMQKVTGTTHFINDRRANVDLPSTVIKLPWSGLPTIYQTNTVAIYRCRTKDDTFHFQAKFFKYNMVSIPYVPLYLVPGTGIS